MFFAVRKNRMLSNPGKRPSPAFGDKKDSYAYRLTETRERILLIFKKEYGIL